MGSGWSVVGQLAVNGQSWGRQCIQWAVNTAGGQPVHSVGKLEQAVGSQQAA